MRLEGEALKLFALELASTMPPTPPQDGTLGLPVLDATPRARAIRRIADIANGRGWQLAVTRALDEYGASYVSDLPTEAIFALRDRMEQYEDCAEVCCDPEDAFPAR